MGLNDLTPQLRTRLSRMERAVGLFVTVATLLLLTGFAYYIYVTAERKGWFRTKVRYQTSLLTASGLKQGDPVKLMGFAVGEITSVEANDPDAYYNVTVDFWVKDNYYGYLWTDSHAKVVAADFLGNRYLEVTKGTFGAPTVLGDDKGKKSIMVLLSSRVQEEIKRREKEILESGKLGPKVDGKYTEKQRKEAKELAKAELAEQIKAHPGTYYTNIAKAPPYWMEPLESPALADRLEQVVNVVETALPNILGLTNQLAGLLTNASSTTAKLNVILDETRPALTNLAAITTRLKDEPKGSLGEWLIPTNLNTELSLTLQQARSAVGTAETKVASLADNIDKSLMSVANITSNLNTQVQANTNLVTEISRTIVNADDFVQGLKRHWLLRSAFKKKEKEAKAAAKALKEEKVPKEEKPPALRSRVYLSPKQK